ncbi:GNAT family N-acetyltransferase [Streptomyces sp. NPDC007861]|uniref:GNAT family N-acetyltransferase n=1 Tax=Streptomyces sp. NPDC007861 TaxID=3154893 RepID=UPI0033E079EA
MTQQATITVERLDGPAAAQAEEAFRTVYAEAFAGPPYDETADSVEAAFRRFPCLTGQSGFRAALARTADGEPVGMAYGRPLGPDAGGEEGHRTLATFGLMELAVRGPWRRRGVARRLHEALLDGVPADRVLLHVHPDSTAASAAYRAWGYRKAGEARPWEGADLHDVMVLDL